MRGVGTAEDDSVGGGTAGIPRIASRIKWGMERGHGMGARLQGPGALLDGADCELDAGPLVPHALRPAVGGEKGEGARIENGFQRLPSHAR